MGWLYFVDLHQLETLDLGYQVFTWCQEVVFESNQVVWIMIQNYIILNQSSLANMLWMVTIALTAKWFKKYPITTRTHWSWMVESNKRRNRKIFLHWRNFSSAERISSASDRWFSWVVIWEIRNVDIPSLMPSNVQFGRNACFRYTHSLQSMRNHLVFFSPFDASFLEFFIQFRSEFYLRRKAPSTPSLEFIAMSIKALEEKLYMQLTEPCDCKHIVIDERCCQNIKSLLITDLEKLEVLIVRNHCFNNCVPLTVNDRSDYGCRIRNCPCLSQIQIANGAFIGYRTFELTELPSLRSLEVGRNCFIFVLSFTLKGCHDLIAEWIDLPKLREVFIDHFSFGCQSISFISNSVCELNTQICQN